MFKRLMIALLGAATVASVATGVAAQDLIADGSEGLNATLWMQKAHEYAFSTEQIYRLARFRLARAHREGNALIDDERAASPKWKRPAIILDLDETVLDNSPFQGAVVSRTRYYKREEWNAWLAQEAADALPGAKSFLEAAKAMGFRIFYVTNRECDKNTAPTAYPHPACPNREHTLANLRKLGLPFADDPKALLMRYDQPDWGDGKSARRRFIGSKHRVAMLVGDDLGDFLPTPLEQALRATVPASRRVADPLVTESDTFKRYRARFGKDWFLLPNPAYGSWETALGLRPACLEVTPRKEGDECYVAALTRKHSQVVAAEPAP